MPGIGFLGAGQMASALATAWAKAGLLDVAKSVAADPVAAAREKFTAITGVRATASNREVLDSCETIVLAVKPQVMPAVLAEVRPAIAAKHLVVSIAAGVTLKTLGQHLGESTRLVRVMPNTPCLVGASASAYSSAATATAADVELTGRLFGAVGKAFSLPEHLLDAVTGLSGSGPAFVYVMIEALADGGVKAGLPRDVALALAAQTVLGSAKMVLETGQHPAALKDAVASPGGTTIAGLQVIERGGLRAALIDAVDAAARRAQELGRS
ncbi:MAG: pyrroline-5-carboxylate reductase [Gemmataceae bacterium]